MQTDLVTKIEATIPGLVQVVRLAGCHLSAADVQIDVRPAPHRAPTFQPVGKIAVYSFFIGPKCLKVGIVGAKSQPRYTSQHYNPGSSNSNLAKSLLAQPQAVNLEKLSSDEVGLWMKERLCRADLLIPAETGMRALRLVEAFLHVRWEPVFEGRA